MKYFGISLIAATSFLTSCSPKEDPVEYNDRIVGRIDGAIQSINGLESTFESYIPEQMDSAYQVLMLSLQESVGAVDSIGPLGSDSLLRNAAESTLQQHLNVARDLYPEYISLLKVPDSLFTPELQTRAFELKDEIDTQNADAQQLFINAQATFGKEHNLLFGDQAGEE